MRHRRWRWIAIGGAIIGLSILGSTTPTSASAGDCRVFYSAD